MEEKKDNINKKFLSEYLSNNPTIKQIVISL